MGTSSKALVEYRGGAGLFHGVVDLCCRKSVWDAAAADDNVRGGGRPLVETKTLSRRITSSWRAANDSVQRTVFLEGVGASTSAASSVSVMVSCVCSTLAFVVKDEVSSSHAIGSGHMRELKIPV
jgi:hypothetical protein